MSIEFGKSNENVIKIDPFDKDNELPIEVYDNHNDAYLSFWLSISETKKLAAFLQEQLAIKGISDKPDNNAK